MIYHLAKTILQHGIYHQKLSIWPKTQPHHFYNHSLHCNEQWVRAAEMCVALFSVSKQSTHTYSSTKHLFQEQQEECLMRVIIYLWVSAIRGHFWYALFKGEALADKSFFCSTSGRQVPKTTCQPHLPSLSSLVQDHLQTCECLKDSKKSHLWDWHTKGI